MAVGLLVGEAVFRGVLVPEVASESRRACTACDGDQGRGKEGIDLLDKEGGDGLAGRAPGGEGVNEDQVLLQGSVELGLAIVVGVESASKSAKGGAAHTGTASSKYARGAGWFVKVFFGSVQPTSRRCGQPCWAKRRGSFCR
ncbi:hypothetical protein CTA1_12068 [Colletotrichum tanaceti]|uniref:Uncharacterized protein n=1 Tax=Colletotrichum tanaceti TaxID=1306861 RepID=A0A4U6XBY1_9PEZI|nr:hypothetical protein CTA1_12068 [Colletotrichum tanaceti]